MGRRGRRLRVRARCRLRRLESEGYAEQRAVLRIQSDSNRLQAPAGRDTDPQGCSRSFIHPRPRWAGFRSVSRVPRRGEPASSRGRPTEGRHGATQGQHSVPAQSTRGGRPPVVLFYPTQCPPGLPCGSLRSARASSVRRSGPKGSTSPLRGSEPHSCGTSLHRPAAVTTKFRRRLLARRRSRPSRPPILQAAVTRVVTARDAERAGARLGPGGARRVVGRPARPARESQSIHVQYVQNGPQYGISLLSALNVQNPAFHPPSPQFDSPGGTPAQRGSRRASSASRM